jgi:hypothetical protein
MKKLPDDPLCFADSLKEAIKYGFSPLYVRGRFFVSHTSKIYIFLIKAPPGNKKLIFSIFLQLYINSTKGWENPSFL